MIPNLSKEMIDVMQQLRKRLRSEFDVDIRLSQPNVVQQILEWVDKSHDQKTRLLFADLEDMMGVELEHHRDPEEEASRKASHDAVVKRIYRGQVIEEPVRTSSQSVNHSTRIYRGQVVA